MGELTYKADFLADKDLTSVGFKNAAGKQQFMPAYSLDPQGNATGLVGPDGTQTSVLPRFSPTASGSNVQSAPVSLPVTNASTYTGTGAAFRVSLGWRPKFVVVKGEAATKATWITRRTWFDRAAYFDNTALESTTAAVTITDDGFIVGANANVNTAAAVYHYFAFRDDGFEAIISADYAGNTSSNRTMRLFEGYSLAAALIKRDNVEYPVIAIAGKAAAKADGSAATTATINTDGTLTLGQGADVNIWSGNAGEATAALGFIKNHPSIYVTTYIGTGVQKVLQTPFDECEALFIFPRAAGTGSIGQMWLSTLTTNGDLFPLSAAAKTTGSTAITSFSASRFVMGAGAVTNQAATEYVAIAFRKNRSNQTPANSYNYRPLRNNKTLLLDPSAYVDCGTSDTLKIDGAMSLEWFGQHIQNSTGGWTLGAGVNDETKELPLIWRSNGADATAGSVSFGMFVAQGLFGNSVSPGVFAAVTNYFNLPQSNGGFDLDLNQPWQTGIGVPASALVHIALTHNGGGVWRLYINGQLVKERNRDMTAAATPLPNIQGGTGHRTIINGRKRGSATPDHTGYRQSFRMARIYARELSRVEVLNNYNSLFADNTASPIADYVEMWDAANASGVSLPATKYAANNGTINGTAYIEG